MRGAVLLSLLLGLGIWQAVVTLTGVPRFILPGPGLVAETLWSSRALIFEHALITITEVLAEPNFILVSKAGVDPGTVSLDKIEFTQRLEAEIMKDLSKSETVHG